jgi:hypothetical protein
VKKLLSVLVAVGLCLGVTQGAIAKSKAPTETVYFSVGQSKLTKATKASLSALAKTLKPTDTVNIRGYVQKSSSSSNDLRLSSSRAAAVKAYLVALGVKSKITSKGYGLPKSKRSLADSRRADIYVVRAAVTPDAIGSISGIIRRSFPYDDCTDIQLDYVKLYQGTIPISTIIGPTWSSTPSGNMFICEYAYTFQDLPNGTYSVEESFTQFAKCPWGVRGTPQPTWTYLGTDDDDLNQVHRIDNLVIAGGADLTGIDLLMRNID